MKIGEALTAIGFYMMLVGLAIGIIYAAEPLLSFIISRITKLPWHLAGILIFVVGGIVVWIVGMLVEGYHEQS